MGRWVRVLGTAAGALLAASLAWGEVFRAGPLTGPAPEGAGPARAFAPWEEVRAGSWSQAFLEAARAALQEAGGLLLVGSTDAVGPRALNESLGLQYAARAAASLAPELSADPWRFSCASAGEDPAAPAGVSLFPWSPPTEAARAPSPVLVLDPAPGLPRGPRLWALWRDGGSPALWSAGAADGGAATVWASGAGARQFLAPLPGRAEVAAVGAGFGAAGPEVVPVRPAPAREESGLTLTLEGVDSWWARLRPALPPGVTEVRLWAGGVPYPVPVRAGRAGDVPVALLPGAGAAYLQALDPRGRVVVGPVVELPPGQGEPPSQVVILVWDGEGVDLDLHAWSDSLHTHPQDPDPAFSAGAVPGTRLLFDGDSAGRAAALASWRDEGLEVEVWCYSDLSGAGGRAWVHLIDRPGDRLAARRTVFGPRTVSRAPLEVRWPLPRAGEPGGTL